MKMQRAKDVVLGAVVGALLIGAAPMAFAKVADAMVPVNYNDIKVTVDGEELKTDKEPFIYEGTTYLPVRAVAEAVGKEVGWDSATKTVTLTSKEATKDDTKATAEAKKDDTKATAEAKKDDTKAATDNTKVATNK